MANSYAATLATLAPDVSYAFDEASGAFENEGASGAMDLPGSGVTSDVYPYQQFGLIRNAPIEYGFWTASQATGIALVSDVNPTGAPAASGWTTGTWSCIFNRTLQGDPDDEGVPISQAFNDNDTSFSDTEGWAMRVDTNGKLWFTIGTNTSVGTVDHIYWVSTDNVITERASYIVTVVQRADGTGFHCFINGAEVAGSTVFAGDDWESNALDIDSCVEALFGDPANDVTRFSVNGVLSGASPARDDFLNGCVQRPAVWRNTALTDSQIISLHAAANLDGTVDDFYEYMISRFADTEDENFKASPLYMNLGPVYGSSALANSNNIAHIGTNNDNSLRMAWTGTRNGSNLTAGTGGDDKPVSRFPTYYQRTQDNSNVYDTGAPQNEPVSHSTGTMCILMTMPDNLGSSQVRCIQGFGQGEQSNDFNVAIFVGQTVTGYTLTWVIGDMTNDNVKTGDYYQALSLPEDNGLITANFPRFFMVTLTQDGTGVKMYVNDEEITELAITSSGSTFDENSWWNTVGTSSVNRYSATNFPANNDSVDELDIHMDFILPSYALSASEVQELWEAVNGTFPAAPSDAPDGGFNDTLTNTGNESDPNGPGPDHYWRMNAETGNPQDVGISDIDGSVIAVGGDPSYRVEGPLIEDPTNYAIYLDGQGDYFEVGVDFVTGALVTSDTEGTIGCFISVNDLSADCIIYSQADDTAAQYFKFGVANGVPYLEIQTSAGNYVRVDSSFTITDFDFLFFVVTNDGTNWLPYIQGVFDSGGLITEVGTGVEGIWFDDITTTRTAIGALADSSFTTETRARESEIFIYDEVLSPNQIANLFAAAERDGLGVETNTLGIVEFEDVIFLNGSIADIKVQRNDSTMQQVLKLKSCHFRGGVEADDAQSILLEGDIKAQIHNTDWNLGTTPTTGRCAIRATQADPTQEPASYGSLIVSDCAFDRMGHFDTLDQPAVYVESGFEASILRNKFFDSYGFSVGWRGDARRLLVRGNLMDGSVSGVAALYCQTGLNTSIGSDWIIDGNGISNLDAGLGMFITGGNSDASQFARRILIGKNRLIGIPDDAIAASGIQDASIYSNMINGCVEGVRLGFILGSIGVRGNRIEGNSADAIICAEGSVQTVLLSVVDNIINGGAAADGVTLTNLSDLILSFNRFQSAQTAMNLGTITGRGLVDGNVLESVTTPLFFTTGSAPAGLRMGKNMMENIGDAETLTVSAEAVSVLAPYHLITSGAASDLATLNGNQGEGETTVLLLASGSSDINLKDGTGDMTLDGDYLMATPGESNVWLVKTSTGWNELSRA